MTNLTHVFSVLATPGTLSPFYYIWSRLLPKLYQSFSFPLLLYLVFVLQMYAFLFIFSHKLFLCVEASLQILKDPSLSMHITKGDPEGCSKLHVHMLLLSGRFSTGHCQQHVDHSTVWFHCSKEHTAF